ncbi:MAG: hypothetical protein HZC48_06030 [Nitrospirae bacterium]|nr:hypothetical protein [Nitrospirota bacterium]
MECTDIVVLEWTFSPSNYFEDEIHLKRDEYEMVIANGKVEAKVRSDAYDKNPNMRQELHDALNARFLGAQLLVHKLYELSDASMRRLHPDGRRCMTVFLPAGRISLSSGIVDLVLTDKNGNVVSDSKKDRIKKKQELADLAERHQDPTTKSLLNSYQSAVNDPNNALVHLYEIRDTLSKKFGGESAACKVLNISNTQWRRLGHLANNEPLKQGRHRGKNPGKLRNATVEELTEARNLARHFIEAYLIYMESGQI